MSFFHPNSLLWALLGLLIAAMYFTRFLRRRRNVSTLMIWQRALALRSPWRRRRGLVSLIVQLGLLALLVIALSEPYWRSAWNSARTIVLVIDNSASMNATDVETSRLWQARRDTARLIDDLHRYEKMAILSAGGLVRVQTGFTNDQKTLLTALTAVTPTDGNNRMDEALNLAQRMLAEHRNPRIVVLTDGGFTRRMLDESPSEEFVIYSAGSDGFAESETGNVGITRFEARPSPLDASAYDVFIAILNSGASRRTCQLEVALNGQAQISKALTIEAGQRQQEFFRVPATQGLLSARLDIEDHLAADNFAATVLEHRLPYVIQVVGTAEASAGDKSLRKLTAALEVLPWPVTYVEESATDARALTVFPFAVPSQLPEGPVLAIAPSGDCNFWKNRRIVEKSIVAPLDANPPLIRDLLAGTDFANAVLDAAMYVEFESPPDFVLASEDGAPILSAWDRSGGRILLLHVPLAKSDVASRSTLPTLLANAVAWLLDETLAERPSTRTEDLLRIEQQQAPDEIQSPFGLASTIAPGQSILGPLDQAGGWQIGTVSKQPNQVLSSNLLSARESDLRPSPDVPQSALPLRGGGDGSPLWMAFVFLALIGLVAEWILQHRGILV